MANGANGSLLSKALDKGVAVFGFIAIGLVMVFATRWLAIEFLKPIKDRHLRLIDTLNERSIEYGGSQERQLKISQDILEEQQNLRKVMQEAGTTLKKSLAADLQNIDETLRNRGMAEEIRKEIIDSLREFDGEKGTE